MTIRNISFQEVAKRLELEKAPNEPKLLLTLHELNDQGLFPPGPLESLPKHILDRIITFLDEKSVLSLRITSVACRCFVRENLVQEASFLIRFFDQASYKIAWQPEESIELDMNLTSIGKELAMRGSFEKALQNLPFSGQSRMIVLKAIALQQVLKGDLTSALTSLNLTGDDLLIESYGNIALQLAEHGQYENALGFAARIPLPDNRHVALRTYISILRAQVERGDDPFAFKLAEWLINSNFQADKDQFYTAIASQQVEQGQYEHALVTLDKIEPQENYSKARAEIEREQTRLLNRAKDWANPEAITSLGVRNIVYDELVLHHLKKGQLNTAREYFQSMTARAPRDGTCIFLAEALICNDKLGAAIQLVDLILKPENKDEIYAWIAPAQAKQGDFLRCLHTLDQIRNSAIQVQAYQKVVTALTHWLNTKL